MTTPDQAGPDVHPPSGPPITFIDFLLDETGSMRLCAAETRAGFDAFVAAQAAVVGECFLTLSTFDSTGVRTPYENLRIDAVLPLSFFPGEMTNLFDCMGERLAAVMDQRREGTSLFVVMTDGDDNASAFWTMESVRDLVVRAQDQGVVVLFLGPPGQAMEVGSGLGIPAERVRPFDTAQMRETMDEVSAVVTAFRSGSDAAGLTQENVDEDR